MTRYKLQIVERSKISNNGMLSYWENFVGSIGITYTHPQFVRVRDEKLLYEYNARFDKDRNYLSFKTEADALAFKLRYI
jgi:hypothetical protein